MGQVHPAIDDKLTRWLLRQPLLIVATAPLAADGHVNVSPKGMAGTFAVLDPHRVAYLDYTGSGVETIAHLRENGRIVLMLCSFEGAPKIVRLHGRGRVVLPDDAEFADLRSRFGKERTQGQRSIVLVDVERVSDSCGYAVPQMDFRADRDVLDRDHARRDEDYLDRYRRNHNAESIDGLPGLPGGALV
jgi:Pyridoxamine 5'-phosphate oxidase